MLPAVREMKGYVALSMSAERSTGTVGVMSLWETEDDLRASEAQVADVRRASITASGGRLASTEVFEVALSVMGEEPPAPGCALRVITDEFDPAKTDELIAMFRDEVVPGVKSTPGFRAIRLLVDRASGRGVVGSVWADAAALQATEEGFAERRSITEAKGVKITSVSHRELLLNDARS